MKPAINRRRLVLPQPLGPSNVVILPSGTLRLTFETAATVPNLLLRLISSTYPLGIEHSQYGARRTRQPPGKSHCRESDRQQSGGQSGCRFESVVTDQPEDRESRHLGARGYEKDGDAQIGDATH